MSPNDRRPMLDNRTRLKNKSGGRMHIRIGSMHHRLSGREFRPVRDPFLDDEGGLKVITLFVERVMAEIPSPVERFHQVVIDMTQLVFDLVNEADQRGHKIIAPNLVSIIGS